MSETAMTEQKGDMGVVRVPQMAVVGATSLLQAITVAASNPAVDMDKMERLFAMHEKLVAQEREAAWNAAMSRAQANIQPVFASQRNMHTQSQYADLGEINKAIMPVYAAEGLAVTFGTAESSIQNFLRVVATVTHEKGHSRQYHIDLPPDDIGSKGNVNKTGVQATGSTNTYGRRYLLLMIFNVATYDDTDGNNPNGTAKATTGASARSVAANAFDDLDPEAQKEVQTIADCVIAEDAQKGAEASLALLRSETAHLEPEMKAALHSRFSKAMRSGWNRVDREAKARKETDDFMG